MVVDRAAAADLHVDVGDRDGETHGAVGERLGPAQLVEVERVDVVDREPEPLAQVAHRAEGLGRVRRRALELAQHVGPERRPEAEVLHLEGGDAGEVVGVHGWRRSRPACLQPIARSPSATFGHARLPGNRVFQEPAGSLIGSFLRSIGWATVAVRPAGAAAQRARLRMPRRGRAANRVSATGGRRRARA